MLPSFCLSNNAIPLSHTAAVTNMQIRRLRILATFRTANSYFPYWEFGNTVSETQSDSDEHNSWPGQRISIVLTRLSYISFVVWDRSIDKS